MSASPSTTAPAVPLEIVRAGLDSLKAYTVPAVPPPVKLDANESPWPLPGEVAERVAAALGAIPMHRYPDARAEGLREAVCAYTGSRPEELVLGVGSDEIISILLTALGRPRPGTDAATVVVPDPSFVMYRIAALTHGLRPVLVDLDASYGLDRDAMASVIEEHAPNLVFLASPNNPTGNTFDRDAVSHLVERFSETLFILDEAYGPFADGDHYDWVERYPNVGVLGTLSKVGFAAARVGWVRLNAALAHEVDKVRSPFNLSAHAQEIGRLALTDLRPILEEHLQSIRDERERLLVELARLPLRVYPTQANFVLCELADDVGKVVDQLLEHGVAIRAFRAHPRLAKSVRITVGRPDENAKLLEGLTAILT